MSWYAKFAPYNKTIESALAYLTTLGTVLLMADHMIPPNVGVPVFAFFGGVGVFRVWYIRNEPLIEQVVNESEDLYEDFRHVAHPEDVEAPTPVAQSNAVSTSLTAVHEVAGFTDAVPDYPVYSQHNDLPTAAIVTAASPEDPGRHSA